MPLPGKFCFGILEEDNPLKSYFRFKPLLLENEGKFESFAEAENYPEEGCIRIVPDKNESSHFKARMRRTGRYAVVDLRNHPGENDKIRPNKNYRGDGVEQNANIIYSDVVREPAPASVMEIISLDIPEDSAQMALTIPLPATQHVLVRGTDGALNPYIWTCEAMENIEGGVSLTRSEIAPTLEKAQYFDIPGFREETLHFALAAPGETLFELPSKEETADKPEAPAAEAPAAEEPAAVEAVPAEPVRPAVRAEQPVKPEAHKPIKAEAKPEPARPTRISPRMSPQDQALLMQTGLNPRRGRSLQEVIEDKWRRSRMDQLGHPIPGEAMGQPVVSPIERALFAVREAWALPEARAGLISALSGVDGFYAAQAESAAAAADSALSRELNDLEAQRLMLLDEISALKAGRDDTKENLLKEIRKNNAAQLEENEKQLALQREELAQLQKQMEEALSAKKMAEESLNKLTLENFDQRLSEYALVSHAADLIWQLKNPAEQKPEVSAIATCAPAAEELISSVRCFFEKAGHPLTNDEAVNLLACVALSPVTLISGPTGSGKSSTAALLAAALGVTKAGRCAHLAPAAKADVCDEITACADTDVPVLAVLDDVNLVSDDAVSTALLAHLESGKANPALRLIATAQDAPAGYPLRARLLDRAFMIRLGNVSAEADWTPAPVSIADVELTVSQNALATAFTPDAGSIPDAVRERMKKLREALKAQGVLLSRRTLDAMWTYCAAVTKLMQRDALAVFDLAFAQRALPSILASASLEALHALPTILSDMPVSLELLDQPLALEL